MESSTETRKEQGKTAINSENRHKYVNPEWD